MPILLKISVGVAVTYKKTFKDNNCLTGIYLIYDKSIFYSSKVSDVFLHFISKLQWRKKLSYKYYNQRKACNNGNVQSHDQERSKLNTVDTNRGAHISFNKNNIAAI